jgi:hypothetical protein
MRAGAMPTELLGVLTAFVGSGVDTETLDAAELQSWIAFMRDLAARSVKAITPETSDTMTPPGGWEDVELTPEDFDELPVVDQQALRVIALRRSTPNTVTVQTLLDDEMIEDQRAAWAKAREAGGTVDAWTDFRDNGPGPVAGDDREDVRPEPVAVVPGT